MSRQRSIRKKSVLSFDDEEEEEGPPLALPPAAKAAQAARDKQRKAQKKVLLSFDDVGGDADSGGPPSAKSRSGLPRASLRAPSAVAPPPVDERAQRINTQTSGAGEYTAERLKELQQNARSLPASSKPAGAPAFKLSGSFKPAAPAADDRFQYNVQAGGVVRPSPQQQQSLARPSSRGGGAMPLPPPSVPPPPGTGAVPPLAGQRAAAAAAPPASVAEEEEEEADIPDEEMIAWAKAKRERLRGAHLAPDYIPTASAPDALSRLRDKKRAEEDLGAAAGSGSEEEQEDQMRMKFMGAGPPAAAQGAKGKARGGAGAGSGDDEADGDEDWAQEQIRKGMGGLAAPGAPAAQPGAVAGAAANGAQAPGRSSVAAALASGGSQHAAIQAAAAEVLKTLQAGLQRLQMSRRQADKNLERTSNNLQGSLAAVARLEGELEAASAKYVLVQGLKAYVADLCNMLQDKSPLVEELEEALLELYEGRAAALERRRAAGDVEERPPAEAAVAAAMAVLSRGGAGAAAAAAAEAAAAAAEEKLLGLDLPIELDEFGRDANAEKKAELAQHAKQRRAHLEALERQFEAQAAGGGAAVAEPRFGEDTSEESEGEVSHFSTRQGEVQDAADAVFRDADDEFGSLPAVKRRLEEWKARQPGAYRDAYVSLSAPALFAPFVRLELLKWRPLHGGDTGFDSQQWYQQLFDYGMAHDPASLDHDDPDANLVPQLVQKLVLPLAKQLLAGVWSPYSRRQSRAAAAMLADLLVYVPADDEALQEVMRQAQSKLEAAVGALMLPPWPPAALAASRQAAIHLSQRFGRGVRLLGSVCAFDSSLPRGVLQRLALDQLMTQRLLPYARAAAGVPALAADRAARLVAALPAEWFHPGSPPPRGCEGLVELLVLLSRSLEALAAGGSRDVVSTSAARQVSDALLKLGNTARANTLSKTFGIL
ncbi:hypothetical protein D9Q98_000296 [Chlorella vulgaris]|uniref:GCF C-terminal domain-containing protein n=1 Tax=Chlorella vulgaris TaxID=3077 RepID=A0A9D4TY54_CHLVU|nr:hypothetical protein D9Q98_000296 [Chlorella vulgaris]